MLHEIQMAEAQIRQEEDKVLEIMEEMEKGETIFPPETPTRILSPF
jgi:hypothetical protein